MSSRRELTKLMQIKGTPYLMMNNDELREYYAGKLLSKRIKVFYDTAVNKKGASDAIVKI